MEVVVVGVAEGHKKHDRVDDSLYGRSVSILILKRKERASGVTW